MFLSNNTQVKITQPFFWNLSWLDPHFYVCFFRFPFANSLKFRGFTLDNAFLCCLSLCHSLCLNRPSLICSFHFTKSVYRFQFYLSFVTVFLFLSLIFFSLFHSLSLYIFLSLSLSLSFSLSFFFSLSLSLSIYLSLNLYNR